METTWPYFNLAVVYYRKQIRVSSCAATHLKCKMRFLLPTGNVVKLSHRNVAKLGGWDRILDAMGGMHWSSVSYPTPT